MDEKLNLEKTINKLKLKNKQYCEEKSEIAKQYTVLKQQHLNMVYLTTKYICS